MSNVETVRFARLQHEQVISRDGVGVLSFAFTNRGENAASIEFWNEPEADRVEEEYDNPPVWVPAGATVRYENCLEPFEAGLCVSGGDEMIEAQFQIVELHYGSLAKLIDNLRDE
jgi:hypothetical protein